MNRRYVLAVATGAVLGAAFVSGASVSSSAKPIDEKRPDTAKPPIVVGQKTAVFNMAGVMRDFNQAKYQVYLLNEKKTELSKQILTWRAEYVAIQNTLKEKPDHPQKDELSKKMLGLSRKIEDEDREINKQLNTEASVIISDLYDMIKAMVDTTAKENGFQIVFAYPDAVTPEERNSPYIKELKLKPPAAQPFYVAPEADITAPVVKALNEKHPPIDPKTKKPVDVSTLPAPAPPTNTQPQITFPPKP
ncbi:MAG TPA: OmpH family outer membrane protein [Gemmata sp.]